MKRIVVKVGTNLLTLPDRHLNLEFMAQLAREVKRLFANDIEVILVTSGAVAAGRGELTIDHADSLITKQALAAIGQGVLMEHYRAAFTDGRATILAQILLTPHDFENLDTLQNTHNTLRLLLTSKVLPIVNENDVTATDELKYMANDRLAARVANLVGADALILLTDVAGLHTADPSHTPEAALIKEISKKELTAVNAGGPKEGGNGGMRTKCEAAMIAECPVYIVSGKQKNALTDIVLKSENPGTRIS